MAKVLTDKGWVVTEKEKTETKEASVKANKKDLAELKSCKEKLNDLADFLMEMFPSQVGPTVYTEKAVDTAIKIMLEMKDMIQNGMEEKLIGEGTPLPTPGGAANVAEDGGKK